jgi:Mn2+/Fe2+ NRAMP family transporter
MAVPSSLRKAIGPGLIFAAAAVGVSHLVQSTRAGAGWGVSLIVVILLANLLKYPAFRFGPEYAAATGRPLIDGYRAQGRWAVWLYLALTLATMFTVQAAVTLVTAALLKSTLGLTASPAVISAGLLAVCAGLLAVGQYRWLDRITRVLVMVLTVSTLAATALVLPRVDWSGPWFPSPSSLDLRTLAFCAALFGWMPSAIDVSVWQSLWTLERARDSGHAPTVRESLFDFHAGYIGTVVLAVCFALLGAGVMHADGVVLQESAGAFAGQVVDLYAATLGAWSRPLIGIAAFAVMFSTTLTVVDGFPRALSVAIVRGLGDGADPARDAQRTRTLYWVGIAAIAAGAVTIVALFLSSFRAMIDLATTLSFLTAPILSTLNHRCMFRGDVPPDARPSRRVWTLSVVGIAAQAAFAIGYIALLATR